MILVKQKKMSPGMMNMMQTWSRVYEKSGSENKWSESY